ncbi:hypothetical protein P7K49_023636 [Saguinus oedipus]|uniref:Uncharacterized protein n=1 Tax=Saguinus oedipus TaxID=9490 RepID=A0ABQ9UN06_SAGOE|nr:hypothetical protein P7K49_023636 [Saguinus oedipus]
MSRALPARCCNHGYNSWHCGLLPERQSVLVHSHHPQLWLPHMGCLLASEYPLSEPWAPGLFHSVLGGPPSHPPEQWVLACLADSCGRVLVCHSIVQAQRHHKSPGSATLVPTDFPVWDSVSQHLDCLQTKATKTNLKMFESLLHTLTFMFTFFVCGG